MTDRPPRPPVIVRGRQEPLAGVPFHSAGPLRRWLVASRDLDPALGFHIAVHDFADVEPGRRDYCSPHVHDYDEINIFHSTSSLEVDVLLGAETVRLEAPATVLIPAGTRHAANVHAGSGFLVAILCGGEYRARED